VHGIVSLLDKDHEARVEALWDELSRDFGVSALLSRVPIPHFSYHVAEQYDVPKLEVALRTFAHVHRPFTVRCAGLALFTGHNPVLYIPIVRTDELSQVHRTLWPYASEAAQGMLEYYHPARWVPHITLAQGDITDATLPPLIGRWLAHSFAWEITIDNVSLICDVDENAAECRRRIDFGGA
jgi:2'-5' RNA ligase